MVVVEVETVVELVMEVKAASEAVNAKKKAMMMTEKVVVIVAMMAVRTA